MGGGRFSSGVVDLNGYDMLEGWAEDQGAKMGCEVELVKGPLYTLPSVRPEERDA